MKKIVLALATVTSLFAGSAFAEGIYVGAAIGQGHTNLDCSGAPTCKRNDTGFKLYGGYKFMPNLSGELTYFDFGKAKAGDATTTLDLRSSAVGLGVAFGGEFAPQWSGVARLGVASVRMKGDATSGGLSGSTSESSTQAYAGLGVGYAIDKTLNVTADLDFTRGKIAGETGNLRLVSIGVNKSF